LVALLHNFYLQDPSTQKHSLPFESVTHAAFTYATSQPALVVHPPLSFVVQVAMKLIHYLSIVYDDGALLQFFSLHTGGLTELSQKHCEV